MFIVSRDGAELRRETDDCHSELDDLVYNESERWCEELKAYPIGDLKNTALSR